MKYVVIALSICLFIFNYLVKSQADFGIDVERYEVVLREGVGDWSFYYLKEIVSWGVLDLLSKFSASWTLPQQLILLDLIVLLGVAAACFRSGFAAERFPFFYPTFAFVLLSFNVLRQYIAFAFLASALIAAVNRWPRRFAIFVILAVLSHNGSIFIVPALALIFFREIRSLHKIMLGIFGFSILLLMSTNDAVIKAFETGGDALEEPFWKVILYASLSLYFALLLRVEPLIKKHQFEMPFFRLEASKFLSLTLFFVGLLITITPFANWIISRNWLTIISLQIFLYLCLERVRGITKSSVRKFVLFYFLPMVVLVIFHAGAWQMAFGEK